MVLHVLVLLVAGQGHTGRDWPVRGLLRLLLQVPERFSCWGCCAMQCMCLLLALTHFDRWGEPFLQETYLYHVHRLDHRHNFSPYFYLTYLSYPGSGAEGTAWSSLLRSPLVSFAPQMALAVGLGLLFGTDKQELVFAWFVQTVAFVVFNKVCTSQVSVILYCI